MTRTRAFFWSLFFRARYGRNYTLHDLSPRELQCVADIEDMLA
jgi:hypothetical protein